MTENTHDSSEKATESGTKDGQDGQDSQDKTAGQNKTDLGIRLTPKDGQVGKDKKEPVEDSPDGMTPQRDPEEVIKDLRKNLLNDFVKVNRSEAGTAEENQPDDEFSFDLPEGDPKDWTDEYMNSVLKRKYGEAFDRLKLVVKDDDDRLNARQKAQVRRDRMKEHNSGPIDPEKEIQSIEVDVEPLLDEERFLQKIDEGIKEYTEFWTDTIAKREAIFSALGGLAEELAANTAMGSPEVPEKLIAMAVDAAMLKDICEKLEIDQSQVLALDPGRNKGDDIAAILRKELHKVLKSYSLQGAG